VALSVLLAYVLAVGAATPTSAGAARCSGEDGPMFRGMTGTNTALGTTNWIYVRDRDLDTDCPDDSERHSTAHMDGPSPRFTEVGWVEDFGIGGQHTWHVWWEYHDSMATVGTFHDGDGVTCCRWFRFRVEFQPANAGWKFYYDNGANGGFTEIGGLQHPGFQQGRPEGETARRPNFDTGNGTGLKDHQENLTKRACDGCSYTQWNDNVADTSVITGWHWVHIAVDEFWVCKNTDPSGPCP
jgi:hypothetical protein